MNLHTDTKLSLAAPSDILRPFLNLDLIIGIDYYFTGFADVRRAMILDIKSDHMVLRQPERRLAKSRIDQTVEATFVHHDLNLNATYRLGWLAKVLDIDDDYRLHEIDLNIAAIRALYLSNPTKSGLTKTNIRQAYRLDNDFSSGIELELTPCDNKANLDNFSRTGLLISAGTPSSFQIGQTLHFNIIFPPAFEYPETRISGKGTVVRLIYEPEEFLVKAGLNFVDLSSCDCRSLDNIIKCHMLAEQRSRVRLTNNRA